MSIYNILLLIFCIPVALLLLKRLLGRTPHRRSNGVFLCLLALPALLWGVPVLMKRMGLERSEESWKNHSFMELHKKLPDGSVQICRLRLRDVAIREIYVAAYLKAGNCLEVFFFREKPVHIPTVTLQAVERAREKPFFLLAVRPGILPENLRHFAYHEPAGYWTPPPGLQPISPEFFIQENP